MEGVPYSPIDQLHALLISVNLFIQPSQGFLSGAMVDKVDQVVVGKIGMHGHSSMDILGGRLTSTTKAEDQLTASMTHSKPLTQYQILGLGKPVGHLEAVRLYFHLSVTEGQ